MTITKIIWGVLSVISFWNMINSSLQLIIKARYSMPIDDKDISMVATSLTTFILFTIVLVCN